MLHESVVQTLLSPHSLGAPAVHVPVPEQWSPKVQALPSMQGAELGLFDHAVLLVLELHHWHWFEGCWFSFAQQTPPIRQWVLAIVCVQALLTHASMVQGKASAQLVSPTQRPAPLQVDDDEQALPSSHGVLLAAVLQPVALLEGSHT